MESKIVNITLEIKDEHITGFETFLNQHFSVINYKIIPNTKDLYDNDKTFKKLVANYKQAQKEKDEYINNHNS